MPDDGSKVIGETASDPAASRHDRPALTAFVADARSEEALRDGLADSVSEDLDIRRGGGVDTSGIAQIDIDAPRAQRREPSGV